MNFIKDKIKHVTLILKSPFFIRKLRVNENYISFSLNTIVTSFNYNNFFLAK